MKTTIEEMVRLGQDLAKLGAYPQAERVLQSQKAMLEQEPVAPRHRFRAMYARLFQAMSAQEAKAILGFPPHSDPSPTEIAKAYKAKAVENHPDRGGSHEKMVEINVAKEILEGKRRDDSGSYGGGGVDEEEEGYARAERIFNDALKKTKKGSAWWDPPHNFLINMTLMGSLNAWVFTLLPMFASKSAYRPKTDRLPEGLVIDPNWTTHPGMKDSLPATEKVVDIMLREAKSAPTLQQTAQHELNWVESKFGVQIPSGVQSALISDVLKVAERRWGVDRLRRKKILVPFDGSKSIQLGSWD